MNKKNNFNLNIITIMTTVDDNNPIIYNKIKIIIFIFLTT